MVDNSLITGILALVGGGGALALFWKPLAAALGSLIINNRAGGEIITNYKEQVSQLKADKEKLETENNQLKERREKDIARITHLENDIRLIKTSLRMLIAITGSGLDDAFKGQVDSMLAKLDGEPDEN